MKSHQRLVLLALALGQGAAQTAGSGTPQLSLALHHVTVVDGKEVLSSAKAALPGQTLRQSLTISAKTAYAKPFSVRLPVPANTTYAGGLRVPTGATVTYSVDGQTYSSKPMRTVTEQGVTRTVPVPEREYRSVKVTLRAMNAGTLLLSYDIRLD